MICIYCRNPQCKCEARKLARFLIGALLVVVSAVVEDSDGRLRDRVQLDIGER